MKQGDIFQSEPLVITKERIMQYAELSNDFNPIHVDDEFAKKTPFGSVIAHGMLSLNLLWMLISDTFGEDSLNNLNMNIRFQKPVKANETIQATAKIIDVKGLDEDKGANIFYLDVEINKSNGETVIKGQVNVKLG